MSYLMWPLLARTRLQVRLIAMVILAMLALACEDTIGTWNARQETIAAARADTTNLASSLADNVAGVFLTMDTILIGLRERVQIDGTDPAALLRLRNFLRERAAALPMLHSVLVLDANGRLLVSADHVLPQGMDMSKSATFLHHRDNPDPGFFISPPIRNVLDGRWVIKMSRRVNRPGGGFAGVVITCVTTDFFEHMFSMFDVGKQGAILMARREGIQLARIPAVPNGVGRDISQGMLFRTEVRTKSQGTFEGVSTVDGTRRLASFRQVADTPVVVMVGRSKAALLAGWQTMAIFHAVGLCLVLGLIYELGRRLGVRIGDSEEQRRLLHQTVLRIEQSERQLTTANDQLAMAQQIAQVGHWSVDLSAGNAVAWSDEVYQIHGRDRRDFTPDLTNGIAAYHPDDQAEVAAAITATMSTGAPFHIEMRLQRPDGSIRHIISRGIRQLDRLGQPNAVFGVFMDVTDQKQAEQALLCAHAEAEAANQALAAANRALEAMALQDALTGLANRRHFDISLDHEFRHARRTSGALALILIDVDRFKQFNDLYGHPAGDACLRRIAGAVGRFAHRAGDLASRYGGEELALLLPDCTEAQALALAGLVTQAVRDLAIAHAGSACGTVTISAGVAVWGPLHGQALATDLIEHADEALYTAKRNGRDRVVGYRELERCEAGREVVLF